MVSFRLWHTPIPHEFRSCAIFLDCKILMVMMSNGLSTPSYYEYYSWSRAADCNTKRDRNANTSHPSLAGGSQQILPTNYPGRMMVCTGRTMGDSGHNAWLHRLWDGPWTRALNNVCKTTMGNYLIGLVAVPPSIPANGKRSTHHTTKHPDL